MADSDEEDDAQRFSRKKKSKKTKVQNFITGRTRRRINSENSVTLAQTRAKFVHSSSISVQGVSLNFFPPDDLNVARSIHVGLPVQVSRSCPLIPVNYRA